jgi:hypothetical protein
LKKREATLHPMEQKAILFKHLGVKEDHSVVDFEVEEVVVMDHHVIRLIETM